MSTDAPQELAEISGGSPSRARTQDGRPVLVGGTRARSARAHQLAYAGALILPVLVFAALLAWFYVDAESQRAEERARLSARQLVLAVDRELTAPTLMLQALATSPLLQTDDLAGFHAHASEIALKLGVTIVLRAPGQPIQLVNTAVPWGAPLVGGNPDIPAFEAEVVRTRQPVVSDLIYGPLQNVWVTVVMVPVLRNGAVVYILSVGLPAKEIARVLREVQLGEGWFSVVVDRKNRVVARHPDHDKFVAHSSPPGWAERATGAEGLWSGRNLENIPVRTAYARSRLTGWVVAVAAPEAILKAPMRRASLALLASGFALGAVAVALASWAGSGLSRAIRSLKGAGAAVARGTTVESVETKVLEVNEVAQALASAAEDARSRQGHLQSILDAIPSAMVVIDTQGFVTSFSRTAEMLFGYSAD